MRTIFHSNRNASVPPVLAAFLIALFFSPVTGNAQAGYAPGGHTGKGGSDIANLAGQLGYNALLILLAAVALMGIVFIGQVSKACADLNRPRRNTRSSFFGLLILAAGLSVFCSSCSAEQRALAAQYRDAAAENHTCPMNQHYTNQADPGFNNRYPSNAYSNWYGPTYCKYCGKRILNKRF